MARQPRLVVPQLPLHIIQRGNNRTKCFLAEADFLVYLALLREARERHGGALHAYCLMGNHVHLLLTPDSETQCAVMMHRVSQRYASYFNRRYGRTGTLWEGRFRSCVVESSRYVLECCRYIELNPVRAGLATDPSAYPWSSYAVSTGARVDPLITAHPEVAAIGASAYLRLVAEGMRPALVNSIRDAINGGYPLGGDAFVARLGAAAGRKLTRGRAGRPAKQKDEQQEKSVAVPDLFSGGGVS